MQNYTCVYIVKHSKQIFSATHFLKYLKNENTNDNKNDVTKYTGATIIFYDHTTQTNYIRVTFTLKTSLEKLPRGLCDIWHVLVLTYNMQN